MNCLLAEAMSNMVPGPIATSCSITAQPAVACVTSTPSRYTAAAWPGPPAAANGAIRPESSAESTGAL